MQTEARFRKLVADMITTANLIREQEAMNGKADPELWRIYYELDEEMGGFIAEHPEYTHRKEYKKMMLKTF